MHSKLSGPFAKIIMTKKIFICISLGIIVMMQALGIIYTKQKQRILHANLQGLYAMRDKLQIEWSQLLLEQGTWEAGTRVERIARDKLDMVVPEKVNIIIL